MSNLTLLNHFSKEVFNFTQKFSSVLSVPQQRNVRELFRGMIITGEGYLNKIGEVSSPEVTDRKITERLSNTLSKIDAETLQQIHINAQIPKYRNEPVLIFSDGGDYQKPHAQKMEKICNAVDGSNGHKKGRGYALHSLMVYGLTSEKITPMTQRLYSTEDDDFRSIWMEEQKNWEQMQNFISSSTQDRITIEDRGCDSKQRFLYYLKTLKSSFVTRICAGKKSRNVVIKNDDGQHIMLSIASLSKRMESQAGDQRKWKNKKLKKTLTSRIAFQKVFLPDYLDIPLYAILVYSDEYDEPLVVLTDLKTSNTTDAWKHFFYYKKRWEIENFFRATKQNFSAEKFLVRDFNKIKAWACIVMLVFSFLLILKQKEKEFFGILYQSLVKFCRKKRDGYKKYKNSIHHLDILAFLRDVFRGIEKEFSGRFCSMKISKYRFFTNDSQMRLFDVRILW